MMQLKKGSMCSDYQQEMVSERKKVKMADEIRYLVELLVEEVIRNGKKHYSYTSKADFDCGIRNSTGSTEVEDGSVLQSVNRPRRTVIKL